MKLEFAEKVINHNYILCVVRIFMKPMLRPFDHVVLHMKAYQNKKTLKPRLKRASLDRFYSFGVKILDSVSRIKFSLNLCQILDWFNIVSANTVFSVKLDVQDKFFDYFRIRFHSILDFCLLQSEVGIERISTLLFFW